MKKKLCKLYQSFFEKCNLWKVASISIVSLTFLVVNLWFINQQFFPVHDFTSGARVFELHNTLKDGQFPPRWSENFGFGYGMPLFQFYAPLAFYIGEFFHLLGFSILTSIKLTFTAFTIFGFIGAYLLGKKLTNKWGGLLVAVAFTVAPYHAVNIYVRGALAEFVATSFMPWSVYFTYLLLEGSKTKKAYLGLTLSLAGIFLSHNVTVVTFMPFWGVTTVFLALVLGKIKRVFPVVLSLVNGVAIAAFFLIPAFVQKGYTRVDTITEGFSQFQLHFLYFRQLFVPNWKYGGSVAGLHDDMSFYLGNDLVLSAVLGGGVVFYLFKKNKARKENRTNLLLFLFFGLMFLLATFATNYKSMRIWEQLPLVSFIQFPWRFLGVASFFLSILAGYLALIPGSIKAGALTFVCLTIILLNGRFFKPEKLIETGYIYQPNRAYIQKTMSGILPDYLPPNVAWETYGPTEDVVVKHGDMEVRVVKATTNEVKVMIDAKKDSSITIKRFIFPNWQIRMDREKTECRITNYFYECPVPAGEHELHLFWSEQGINAISNIISLLGLLVLGGYISLPFVKTQLYAKV